MTKGRAPAVNARERIFSTECDKCGNVSEAEQRAIEDISGRIFDSIMKVLDLKIFNVNIGTRLKPVIKEMIDRFVIEMDIHGLHGRHIGMITQNVLKRLDPVLRSHK